MSADIHSIINLSPLQHTKPPAEWCPNLKSLLCVLCVSAVICPLSASNRGGAEERRDTQR